MMSHSSKVDTLSMCSDTGLTASVDKLERAKGVDVIAIDANEGQANSLTGLQQELLAYFQET